MSNANAIDESVTTPLRALAEKELELLRRLGEVRAQAEAAEVAAGIGFLDDADVNHLDESVKLRAQERAINHAATALRVRRRELLQKMVDAEIAQLRERAAALRADAQVIASQAAPLLDQLASIQETDYAPQSITKSDRILTLVANIERRADELQVMTTGNLQIDGSYTDEQIALGVLEHASDGPTARQILDWVASQPSYAEFCSHRLSIRLSWKDDQIDSGPSCYVRLLEPLTPPPQPETPPLDKGRRMSVGQYLNTESRPDFADSREAARS